MSSWLWLLALVGTFVIVGLILAWADRSFYNELDRRKREGKADLGPERPPMAFRKDPNPPQF